MSRVKVAQFSDLHFSHKNLIEADKCFGHGINRVRALGLDAAVLAGDTTDHALYSQSPAYNALMDRAQELGDICPVIVLQGTILHEPLGFIRNFDRLKSKHPIVSVDKPKMLALIDNQWAEYDEAGPLPRLVVSCLPTMSRAILLRDRTAGEMPQRISEILLSFAEKNYRLRGRGVPTFLISHGTVNGVATEHEYVMLDTDNEFTLGSLCSAGTDAVGLGHIHQHRSWVHPYDGREVPIAYTGSIGRFTYGTTGEKGFCLWDIEPGNARFEVIPTPSVEMIDLEYNGPPDMADLETKAKLCAIGSKVRLIYSIDKEYAGSVDQDRIHALFSHCAELKIVAQEFKAQRARTEGISKLPIADQVGSWCRQTETPSEGIADRVQWVIEATPEEICSELMKKILAKAASRFASKA